MRMTMRTHRRPHRFITKIASVLFLLIFYSKFSFLSILNPIFLCYFALTRISIMVFFINEYTASGSQIYARAAQAYWPSIWHVLVWYKLWNMIVWSVMYACMYFEHLCNSLQIDLFTLHLHLWEQGASGSLATKSAVQYIPVSISWRLVHHQTPTSHLSLATCEARTLCS